jgi:RNA polymerase sigma factor (sigma-70 family)
MQARQIELAMPKSIVDDEETTILRAKDGDGDAFSRLYDAYFDRIYRFFYYRVDDEEMAGDLTSQVFIKAWENLDHYQPRGHPFGAWLFQIARNLAIDHYRTSLEMVSLDGDQIDIEDPAIDVAKQEEDQSRAEWVRAALRQITPEQRQVLVMKFIEGMSTDEIAIMMGKRTGAIRALELRGLKLLSRIMRMDDETIGSYPGRMPDANYDKRINA